MTISVSPRVMPRRGWPSTSESARRERDLRSCSVAAAASSSWFVEPSSGALGPAALFVNLEDHSIYLAVPAVLMLTAVLASYLPARRAMRIDSVIALRGD